MRKDIAFPTLLHCGIAGGSVSMWPLARYLRKFGILTERCGSPIVLMHPVGHHAMKARKCIKKLAEKTGQPISFVGWSMGGLVAVDAMSDAETSGLVRRIITFGTPFDGSYPAYVAAHRPGRLILKAPDEIVPGSPTLERIRALINDPARTWELVTINGPAYLDPLAPAPLKLIKADLQIEGRFAHTSLLGNRSLHRLVAELIVRPRLAPSP